MSLSEKERIKQQNIALLEEVANKEGLDEEGRIVLKRIMLAESNGETNAANGKSRARGLFQAIPSTWNKYADKYDDIDRTDSSKGDGRFNPHQQMLFAVRFTRDNERALTTALGGRPPSSGELYMAHFLGAGGGGGDKGAIDVIKEAEKNPARPIKGFLPNYIFDPNADVYLLINNKERLYFKDFTVSDMQNWADRKMAQPDSYASLSDEERKKWRKDKGIMDWIPDAFGDMKMPVIALVGLAILALVGMAFGGGSISSGSPPPTPNNGGKGRGLFS